MDVRKQIANMCIKWYRPFYALVNRDISIFRHILIQTNTLCTRKCPWCYYGINNNIKDIAMSDSLFKKIIDNLADLRYRGRISLFETNEFLTDKRIFSFLQYARERLPRAWFFLNTNGDLLNEGVIEELFILGLDDLHISSYDNEAFEKNNRFIAAAKEKRIRHFDKRKSWFITSNRGGSLRYLSKGTNVSGFFCDRVNLIMYIKPDGSIVSCFEDFFSENIMGNANNEQLEDIWFGKNFSDLRARLNKGLRLTNKLCRRCNYIGLGGYYKIPKIAYFRKSLQK